MSDVEKTSANRETIKTVKPKMTAAGKNGKSIIAKFFDQRTKSLISLSSRPAKLNSNASPKDSGILPNPQPYTQKANGPKDIFARKLTAPGPRLRIPNLKSELKPDCKPDS